MDVELIRVDVISKTGDERCELVSVAGKASLEDAPVIFSRNEFAESAVVFELEKTHRSFNFFRERVHFFARVFLAVDLNELWKLASARLHDLLVQFGDRNTLADIDDHRKSDRRRGIGERC